ncbi:hypothetical protein EDB81DRAFT_150410 [Dactylonectria macrodidyma]|uniref:Dimethylaniline monooxygenase n=1 Tax=Dactylonectria macrodidyma TaxID=307937 RepID=A0A9P9FNZ0_9HYPO|nr:hypothetical protein EDB81DRAFT_150410 [Dactylonectria macrodidyma]
MDSKSNFFDIIIIGTGVGGLSAAKTYLEIEPKADILLLEKRKTIGGVWADENCYDGLKTNNLLGTYEFTDFPMGEKYGLKEGSHIPGSVLHTYLTDFATHFDILRRIKFETHVQEITKLEKGWMITAKDLETGDSPATPVIYRCNKLIVSSGLASTPNPVSIPGQETFGKPILNHGQLKEEGRRVAEDPSVKSVTIVGASKTGYDTVQLMASHGKQVDWIIRESGGGPVWMSPPWVNMGPFRVMLEHLATMRFFSWFSPCIWGNHDGYGWIRALLHGTWLGRFVVHHFWEKIRQDTVRGNGYRDDPALALLEPYESLFWSARVGVLNYPGNIHDYLLSGQVKITKKDISRLSDDGTVHLSDGNKFHTDAIIAITGWNLAPTVKYMPEGIERELGIPCNTLEGSEASLWETLDNEAEKEILTRFPYLSKQPKQIVPYKQKVTPYRLYRGIASPELTTRNDHSIVYIKMVHSTSNMIIAETQALWAFAYLNNKLDIDRTQVYRQTALSSRYGKLRYPCGFSSWYPEFVYDAIPYADMLLKDLGVKNKRKTTWTKEIFQGYTIQDYKGINQEWIKSRSAM